MRTDRSVASTLQTAISAFSTQTLARAPRAGAGGPSLASPSCPLRAVRHQDSHSSQLSKWHSMELAAWVGGQRNVQRWQEYNQKGKK